MNYNLNSNFFSLGIDKFNNNYIDNSNSSKQHRKQKQKYENNNINYDKLNNILRKSSHDDNSNNSYHKLNGYNNFLSSPQKSYWKNSNNIRINPKSLAPEYYHYQKYLNGSGKNFNNYPSIIDSNNSLENNPSSKKKIVFDQDGNLLKSFDYSEEIYKYDKNYTQENYEINFTDINKNHNSNNSLNLNKQRLLNNKNYNSVNLMKINNMTPQLIHSDNSYNAIMRISKNKSLKLSKYNTLLSDIRKDIINDYDFFTNDYPIKNENGPISQNSILFIQNEESNSKSKNRFKSWVISNFAHEWEDQPWIMIKCQKYDDLEKETLISNYSEHSIFEKGKSYSNSIIENLPLKIAYHSQTIQHIYRNSNNFLEGKTNLYEFPTVSYEVLEEIICYLYYEWFSQYYDKDQDNITLSNSYNKELDIPKYIKDFKFIPKYDYVFLLIEAALYFELSKLTDICADYIAKIFDDVDSFYDLPVQLIKRIIKRLNIHQCLHAEQLLKKEKIENVNIEKIYKKNYLKLLLFNDLQCYKFHSFNNNTLTKPSSFYRKFCIQYLVEQCVKNNSQGKWSTPFNEYIQNLIQNEKESIKELCLTLSEYTIDPILIHTIGTIDKLTLRVEEINQSILENLEILLNTFTVYERTLTKVPPLEINFDIKWNKKQNSNSNNVDERREENIMKVVNLINNFFNKKFGHQSSSFNNRDGILSLKFSMNDRLIKSNIHKNTTTNTCQIIPSLSYNFFNNEILNETMESLLLYTNLTTLNLSGIPLNQTSLTFLLNALSSNKTQSESLDKKMSYSSKLNEYSFNRPIDTSIPTSSTHTLISLKQLSLCQCQLTLPAIEMIINYLEDNDDIDREENKKDRKGKGKAVEELDSSSTNTALSMMILNSLLTSRNSQLQLIDLSYNKFPTAMLFQLISAFNNLQPHLRSIDLSGMDLGISCTELLARNLKSYFSTNTSLNVNNVHSIGGDGSSSNKNIGRALETLLLSNNKIRPNGLILLMKTILMYTSIKEIDLSCNLFTDSISEEFSELFKISEGERSLCVLGLAGYKNDEDNNDTQNCEYLRNMNDYLNSYNGEDESKFNTYYGSVSEFDSITNKYCNKKQESIKNSKERKIQIEKRSQSQEEESKDSNSNNYYKRNQNNNDEENFSEFSFGNLGCQKIIKNLRYYVHLKALDLSYQQIENNTLEFLATQLSYLPNLLFLNIQHNYITDKGLTSFMDIIIKNIKDNNKDIQNINKNNLNKNNTRKDIETIINIEYNYVNFESCKEYIKNFNCNYKTNYILYARNQNNK
ncbi:RNI-like protein [Neocallimastix californiae]|uniref:RNI-like protein n=1 Tax=Neocallimastix californiae TaxID=1754190 RepID=A0A1Y2CP58_9FUNG|nr:RNI-like protein [Neocallimastix californiae]|eukprot:ORY48773.1 RNI-like protein [Neocallimastix californiae]